MLDKTLHKLAAMYENHPQCGSDGALHEMDKLTRISIEQGNLLARLHATIRPKLSIEVGLAYGFSTLFILDALFQTSAGRHIAIDPAEESMWHGIGLQAVRELEFDSRFEHIPEMSITALTDLHKQGIKSEYIYIDGCHNFDYALVDFFCANRLLNLGGILIFDDTWMPAIQKVASFIRTNIRGYKQIPTEVGNVFCIQKLKEDDRAWDHFAEF